MNTRRLARPLAGVMALAAVTATSVALRVNSPTWLLPHFGHDDGLFANLARHLTEGEWLGPYSQLTLIKGPGYPLFIAAAYEAHVPLKLAEHLVHLVAAAVVALAAARVCRSTLVGVVTYVVVALDPSYLGAAASRVSREGLYGSTSLLLAGTALLALTFVPGVVQRGPRFAVPAALASGLAVGLAAAGYYLVRDERSWVAPALVVVAVTGVATWRRPASRRAAVAYGAVALGTGVAASLTLFACIHWVTAQNQDHYGTTVVSDVTEGEIARAYAQWQRVEAGEEIDRVPVNRAQRAAVYVVSPAAAELAPYLEGPGRPFLDPRCDRTPDADGCDYNGGFFLWAMRIAAEERGHTGSGAESQQFFGEIADDIEAACGDELHCTSAGIGPAPPRSRIDLGELWSSYVDTAGYLLSYDVGEPERPYAQVGNEGAFQAMIRPIRGIDGPEAEHVADEARAMKRQGVVSLLTDVYRLGMRIGAPLALVGLALGVVTPAGRRRPAVVLLGAAMLVAVLSRVGLVALVDATSFESSRSHYVLPGVDFLLLFVIAGCWLLATVVRDTTRRGAAAPDDGAGAASDRGPGPGTAPEAEPGGEQAPGRRAPPPLQPAGTSRPPEPLQPTA
jgi:hypothetical protein